MKKSKNGMVAFTVYLTPKMADQIRDIAMMRSYTKSENGKRVSAAEIVRRCVEKGIGRMAIHADGRKK